MADRSGTACLAFFTGPDGPGWYYWDSEYPEEGSVGPFGSAEQAEDHARQAYAVVERVSLEDS